MKHGHRRESHDAGGASASTTGRDGAPSSGQASMGDACWGQRAHTPGGEGASSGGICVGVGTRVWVMRGWSCRGALLRVGVGGLLGVGTVLVTFLDVVGVRASALGLLVA